MTSEDKKLWSLLKGFLYLLSISVMVFLGYIREERNKKAFTPNLEEQIVFETEQKQFSDSVYFAFSYLFDEYNLNQN